MDSKTLDSVLAKIYRQFPDFVGIRPKVRRQESPATANRRSSGEKGSPPVTYLLTFHHKARVDTSQGNRDIERWVRVVVSEKGRIIKITTSR